MERLNERKGKDWSVVHIVLFDGVCHFCSATVRFIIERDEKAYFRFASLQSEAGQALLKKYHIPQQLDSFILIDECTYYVKSTAALRVCKHLRGFWKYLYWLILIPFPIRDRVYDWIAKNRYRWFGKKDCCFVPTEDIKKRFL
ncbi:hypothetical protein AF2641_11495 [Anoxybacillus flavithermus]|nr:hypothetical protein AF2641_11495 [Anoxybacillus flavithermus]